MRNRIRLMVAVLLLALGPLATADEPSSNGISVGAPKVFDNRTLTIMLDSLSQTLQSIQSQQFVDQKTLSAALLAIQGSHSAETNSAVSILGTPTPGITQSIPTGGTALTTNVTTSSVTPTAPTLTEIPAFSGFTPNFGESAGDLLNDSVNLNYQIFNLRLIIERALSDRLSGDQERLQTVLGFNITIDPPHTAVDSVAVVEITLKRDVSDQRWLAIPDATNLSLVALMPQEKTYNAAALSSKSNAFGGSAVVSAFQIGATVRNRQQTFYLYRDTDTVAYERMNGTPGELVFGWMFRPVLGRRSVSPGFRQMFAVVALPGGDCEDPVKCPPRKLSATATTFWKKYDPATLTSFDSDGANRRTNFRYAATLGLLKPKILNDGYKKVREYPSFTVNPTHDYETALHPNVQDVRWTPVGPTNALITVEGDNFFSNTSVILGDKTYPPADGLTLKSNKTLQLLTSQDALASGPAVVSGRYASPEALVVKSGAFDKLPRLELSDPMIGPAIGGRRRLTVSVAGRNLRNVTIPIYLTDLPDDAHPPLITINGHSAQQPYQRFESNGKVIFETSFADEFLDKGFAVLKLAWPFLPDRFSLTRRTTDPRLAYNVVRVGEKNIVITTTTDAGFVNRIDDFTKPLKPGECWQLLAGNTPIKLTTVNCPVGNSAGNQSAIKRGKKTANKKPAATSPVVIDAGPNAVSIAMDGFPDKVVLLEPIFKTAFLLDVPKFNAAPKADAAPALAINQYDSVVVPLTVAKAANVASVMADLKPLTFVPKSDKADETIIQVQITRDLSSKPGAIDLTILDKQGKPVNATNARLIINAVPEKKEAK